MRLSELKAILEDHKLWIQSDGNQGKKANLTDADLQNENLQGVHLWNANLLGANLENANLEGAYLVGAYLQDADLRDANLVGADLEDTYLQGANLQGAKFTTNFKKVKWFNGATFSEDQIPWVVLHPRYPKWADTLKWVKAEADAA